MLSLASSTLIRAGKPIWFASQARKGGAKVIKKTEKDQPRSHTPLDLLFDLLSWVMGRAVDLLAASIQRLVYAIVKPRKPKKEAKKESLRRELEEERQQ